MVSVMDFGNDITFIGNKHGGLLWSCTQILKGNHEPSFLTSQVSQCDKLHVLFNNVQDYDYIVVVRFVHAYDFVTICSVLYNHRSLSQALNIHYGLSVVELTS